MKAAVIFINIVNFLWEFSFSGCRQMVFLFLISRAAKIDLDFIFSINSAAPWCPACKNLEPIWKDFGSWSDDLSINVAKIDVV